MAHLRLKRLLLLGLALVALACVRPAKRAPAAPTPEPFTWQVSTPEAQGMDPALLAQLPTAIAEKHINIHSILVVRNGYIVAETYFPPYTQQTRDEIYSCTKSFVSTLAGIAIDKGYIAGVDQPVLSFFPKRSLAQVDSRKQAMTLEHLLTMTSGLDWPEGDPIYSQMYQSSDWLRFVLDRPMAEEPGSRFNYCSGCSHVLSAIVQERSGMNTLDFARANLFEPLGIDPDWQRDARGIPIGGWGLRLTTRDMAKLGLLYLNEGAWQGRQIVPSGWVKTAVTKQVETDGDLGYGYQWWTYPKWGAYAALGRGGQMIFVLPQERIVVVFKAGNEDNEPLFDLIEEYIVPAVRPVESQGS